MKNKSERESRKKCSNGKTKQEMIECGGGDDRREGGEKIERGRGEKR